ncbi:MAG: CDP-alcohol phosphatidyltransferase family protein [Euryarchaeota archaeon]|nr:CDP-alcohol phosphatidyltransferase family protein [Euryarchaeota archaeon]MDE1835487.1 CDP-alcohol phosphatidyltransferase family protein [Euryarchaeota archaeon]MDE1880380.1 CDP-alcohol phosphatidyltransferase family protein [Euryarchaeota archaeon]MDE2045768.1 CDP-alcohol phosphatidyltransferase family protein [Thermoplasmata archaeon]
MTRHPKAWRAAADLATVANALSGIGAVLYILAGNKPFGLFLILAGVGWDGLDGFFSRRAGGSGTTFGRVADSCADAITFCLAPGAAIAFDLYPRSVWAPWDLAALVVGGAVAAVGIARLVYFTLVAYKRHHFSGASTPQNAMWVILLVLLFQRPGFLVESPPLFLLLAAAFVPLMVLPVRYPKLRRGAPLRRVTAIMATALSGALIAVNLQPFLGTPAFLLAYVATALSAGLLLFFYLAGPFVTPKESEVPSHESTPAA